MTLIDANLLLYAYDDYSPHYTTSHAWLKRTLAGPDPVALSWTTILAFLRLSTSPRVFRRPLSASQTAEVITGWLKDSRWTVLDPGARHWEILEHLLIDGQATGAIVMDAHLAALAIEHGATLASGGKDFTRFPGLRLLNPLAPPPKSH